MPIHVPGKRDRRGKIKGAGRSAVATLSLTAMVDMFTVLVVFLLMNYQTTGEVLPMKENVDLPEAASTEELEPSNVVILGPDGAEINGVMVETIPEIEASQDWVLPRLKEELIRQIAIDKKEKQESITGQIQSAVKDAQAPDRVKLPEVVKVTIQADKKIEILTLKKVMYTITEAGGEAINFAVMKVPGKDGESEEASAEGS